MNGFADEVRRRVDNRSCLVDAIDKGRCGASLADAPHPRVIIDLDETGSPLGPARTKCDFLFFGDPDLVMPIEVKDHGSPDILKVTRQLQAGADAAGRLAPRDVAVRFRPVLVSRDMRRDKQIKLRDARVRFRNHPEIVRQVICGNPLTAVLGDA